VLLIWCVGVIFFGGLCAFAWRELKMAEGSFITALIPLTHHIAAQLHPDPVILQSRILISLGQLRHDPKCMV